MNTAPVTIQTVPALTIDTLAAMLRAAPGFDSTSHRGQLGWRVEGTLVVGHLHHKSILRGDHGRVLLDWQKAGSDTYQIFLCESPLDAATAAKAWLSADPLSR